MLRASVLTLVLPIAVAVGTPAFAGDIPGDSSTSAVLPISTNVTQGRFETANDSDWFRVTLKYYRVRSWRVLAAARRPAGSRGTAASAASARPRGAGARSRSTRDCAAPGAREGPRGR